MRIKSIADLSRMKSGAIALKQPKVAASKAPDYVVFDAAQKRTVIRGGKRVQIPEASSRIYPEPASVGASCETASSKAGKGTIRLRACHVELVMVGAKNSKKVGVAPGAYLRLCSTFHQANAPMIPVSNQREAQAKSKAYCACKKSGKEPEACARQAGLSGAGGLRGRRR